MAIPAHLIEPLALEIAGDFDLSDLELVMLRCTGEGLFEAWVGEGKTVRRTAFELLQEVSRRSFDRTVLLELVMRRPDNRGLGWLILQACPDLVIPKIHTQADMIDRLLRRARQDEPSLDFATLAQRASATAESPNLTLSEEDVEVCVKGGPIDLPRLWSLGKILGSYGAQIPLAVKPALLESTGASAATKRSLWRYLDAMVRAHDLQLPYRLPGLNNVRMSDVYVRLEAQELQGDDSIHPAEVLIGKALTDGASTVVVGAGGAGKSTTLARIITLAWHDPSQVGLARPHLPFSLRFRDLASAGGATVEERLWSAAKASKRLMIEGEAPPEGFLHTWPEIFGAPWLFLLDGLDELSPSMRDDALDWVANLLAFDGTRRAIVATRPVPEIERSRLARLGKMIQLSPLTGSQSRDLGRSLLGESAEALDDELGRTNLSGMLKTPLLLTVAANVFQVEGSLPSGRSALLRQYFDLVLGARMNTAIAERLQRRDLMPMVRAALGELAFEVTERPAVSIRDSLHKICLTLLAKERPSLGELDREATAEELALALIENSGVLVLQDRVEFHHEVFREHLAAENLLRRMRQDKTTLELALLRLADADWQDVVVGAFGLWAGAAQTDAERQDLRDAYDLILWGRPVEQDRSPKWWQFWKSTALGKRHLPPDRALILAPLLLEGPIFDATFAESVLEAATSADHSMFEYQSCSRVFLNAGVDGLVLIERCKDRKDVGAFIDRAFERLVAVLDKPEDAAESGDVERSARLIAWLKPKEAASVFNQRLRNPDTKVAQVRMFARAHSLAGNDAKSWALVRDWLAYGPMTWFERLNEINQILDILYKVSELFSDFQTALAVVKDPHHRPSERLYALFLHLSEMKAEEFSKLCLMVLSDIPSIFDKTTSKIFSGHVGGNISLKDALFVLLDYQIFCRILTYEQQSKPDAWAPMPEGLGAYFAFKTKDAEIYALPYGDLVERSTKGILEGHAGLGEFAALFGELLEKPGGLGDLQPFLTSAALPCNIRETLDNAIVKSSANWHLVFNAFRTTPARLITAVEHMMGGRNTDAFYGLGDSAPRAWEELVTQIDLAIRDGLEVIGFMRIKVRALEAADQYERALEAARALLDHCEISHVARRAEIRLLFRSARTPDQYDDLLPGIGRALEGLPGDDELLYLRFHCLRQLGRIREALGSLPLRDFRDETEPQLLACAAQGCLDLGFSDAAASYVELGNLVKRSDSNACLKVCLELMALTEPGIPRPVDIEGLWLLSNSDLDHMLFAIAAIRAGSHKDETLLALEELRSTGTEKFAEWPHLAVVEHVATGVSVEAVGLFDDAELWHDDIELFRSPDFNLFFAGVFARSCLAGNHVSAEALIDKAFAAGMEGQLRWLVALNRGFFDRLADSRLEEMIHRLSDRVKAEWPEIPIAYDTVEPDLAPNRLADVRNSVPYIMVEALSTGPTGGAQIASEPPLLEQSAPCDRLPRRVVCYLRSIQDFDEERVRAKELMDNYVASPPQTGMFGFFSSNPKLLVLWFLEDGAHVYGQTNFRTNPEAEYDTKFVMNLRDPLLANNFFQAARSWPLSQILFSDGTTFEWFTTTAPFSALGNKCWKI